MEYGELETVERPKFGLWARQRVQAGEGVRRRVVVQDSVAPDGQPVFVEYGDLGLAVTVDIARVHAEARTGERRLLQTGRNPGATSRVRRVGFSRDCACRRW